MEASINTTGSADRWRRAVEGIRKAAQKAKAAWHEQAIAAVRKTALELDYFTVDDVWDRFPDGLTNGSALGSVMIKAKELAWIQPTGEYLRSTRPSMHGKPVTLWESLLA